ncbi:hypothetical protein PAXRUDRAFT_16405 [Paxillus rubicundulus Ve08.2h10]|uniref:Uncharacterized protein n=1 Tax=Paxillus rubicundulus Ve08.2h10 TaxID=930991 RepID=A0A0D0DEG6_9AGAM|nr:hypothetical protein PAXRUDRAFT_16405 [Paxillus rubicundulus Ve08.2h10]
MAVGHAWRSIDYVAYLHWLSLRSMKKEEEDEGVTIKTTTEPQKKRRKVTKKHHKRVFDIAPQHMDEDPPNSKKGTLPFATMVSKMWKEKYPEMKILEGGEWLEGFYCRLRDGEVLQEDASYLKELAEWHERDE